MLGTPVGHSAFVRKWLDERIDDHCALFERIPLVRDTQCAWLLLLLCAGPRAAHVLRNVPPSEA